MKESSNPELEQLMSTEGNQNCVDCSAANPTFVSINNSVFLCENCANAHKTLGKEISDVKSLLNDQLSPEEISLLKIGGNQRFKTLISEYGITDAQSKELKYQLKVADYYRKLLLAERNKDNNPDEYQNMLNSKPNPEVGLQMLVSVTNANQPSQVNQANLDGQPNQPSQANPQQQSELSRDASNLMGKITGFFSSIGNKLNDTVHYYGIDQKITDMKDSINREAKSFGEQHPAIQNAAETTFGAVKTAGTYVADTATKIANSEPVQTISQKVTSTYNDVMNSETVQNISKKTEEQYVNLKNKLISNNNDSQQKPPENNQPENKPSESTENKPSESTENKPSESSENKPSESSENKPSESSENKPTENNEQNSQPQA